MTERAVYALLALVLTLAGVVTVYTASYPTLISSGLPAETEMLRQAGVGFAGLAAAAIMWRFLPERALRGKWLLAWWAVLMALLLAVGVMGAAEGGARRWLPLGPISFQPSELAKPVLTLCAADAIALWKEGRIDGKWCLLLIGLAAIPPLVIICVPQSDMGTAVICVVGMLAAAWFGGAPKRVLAATLALGVAFGLVAINMEGYRANRIAEFAAAAAGDGDASGAGYQAARALYALAAGGFFGSGLGGSKEKFSYLPEADTDYIFAVIGEEGGFIGCMLVIAAFAILLYVGLRISEKAHGGFAGMVTAALPAITAFQAYLNIGCVIGLIPPTGKPLPFFSYGGTSLLATLLMAGIVLALSRADEEWVRYECEKRRRRLRVTTRVNGHRRAHR